jgi:DNA (cytosine-5)-methyltransferase 1
VSPKAIDLFAGPGGLSLGLKKAGFDVIAAVEYDEAAARTYKQNIGNHVFQRNITKIPPSEMKMELESNGRLEAGEELALIAGGPPCPGFSLIGRSKISSLIKSGDIVASEDSRIQFLADERNLLFENFVEYVNYFEPKYFIMENVQGMESYEYEDGDSIVEHIKSRFTDYVVFEDVLCASDYGVPQDRHRIIFLGYHKENANKITFEDVKRRRDPKILTTEDAIIDLSEADAYSSTGEVRVSEPDRGSQKAKDFRKLMRTWEVWDKEEGKFVSSKYGGKKTNHISREPNARDQVLFPMIESGSERHNFDARGGGESSNRVVYGDLYPDQWELLRNKFEEADLDTAEREVDGKIRHYVIKPGVKEWIMYPSRSNSGEGKFVDKFRRIKWDAPSPTIVAHLAKDGYMFIHPWLNRTLSVREAARIQSFPDSFDFQKGGGNSKSDMFRQVGNAVPPLLARAIGESILEALG